MEETTRRRRSNSNADIDALKTSNDMLIRCVQRLCAYTGNNKILTDEGIEHYQPTKVGGKFR